MASDWIDLIEVTRSKAGHYGVVVSKYGRWDEFSSSKSWATVQTLSAMRDLEVLQQALETVESDLSVSLDWPTVVEEIAKLSWLAAATMACRLGLDWPTPRRGQAAVELLTTAPEAVEQLLKRVTSWGHAVLIDVLRHLHARATQPHGTDGAPTAAPRAGARTVRPNGSRRAWRSAERRLFGDPSRLLSRHQEYALGFHASLIEGPQINLCDLAGFESNEDLESAVWDQTNWRALVAACPSAECIEVGEQDGPGISDSFYWVAVSNPVALARQLREAMVGHAIGRSP